MPETNYLYWSDRTAASLGRSLRSGAAVVSEWLKETGKEPSGVMVAGGHVYWVESGTGAIGRVKIDGTVPEPAWLAGAKAVRRGVTDGTYLYWPTTENNIARAKLDGTELNLGFVAAGVAVNSIAVDAAHIYWISGSFAATIGRAKIDGTEVTKEWKATGTESGHGIAVDEAFVYWSSIKDGKIYHVEKATGANKVALLAAASPEFIVLDETYIYWTGSKQIGRARIDGTEVNEGFISGLLELGGIAAGSEPEVIPEPEEEPKPEPEPEPKVEPEPEPEPEAPTPGAELLFDIEPSPGVATVLGPFYLGGFRDHPDFLPLGLNVTQAVNLRLKMVSGKGVYRVILRWHHKRELTAPYVEDEVLLAEENALLDQQFPLRGPWLTIEVERRQQVQTAKFKAILQPVGGVASQSRLGSQTLLSAPGVAVAKEANVQKTMVRTAPGPASLVAAASGEGATRTLLLEQLTSVGGWTRYVQLALPSSLAPITVPLVLPATPIRATIANGTAGEITADLLIGAT